MDKRLTRRGMMARVLGAAARFFCGVRLVAGRSCAGRRFPMKHHHLALPNGRPVWEQPKLWEQAASVESLLVEENNALQLKPSDPIVKTNCHALHLGPQRLLHAKAADFFHEIRTLCEFDEWCYWDNQQDWLDLKFRTFFPEKSEEVGWVSVLMARRPAQFREQQDPTIKVTQEKRARPWPVRAAKYLECAPLELSLDSTLFSIPTKGLLFACESDRVLRKGQVFATRVLRKIHSTRFGIVKNYEEVWVCVAQAGEDEDRLERGHIPAVPESLYRDRAIQVRTTPILNQVKIDIRAMSYTVDAIEIDPRSGRILSMRRNQTPLKAALLLSSPVEHIAVCEALRRLRT